MGATALVACDDSAPTPQPTEVRQGVSQNLASTLPEVQAALKSDANARVPTAEMQRIAEMLQPGSSSALRARLDGIQTKASADDLDAQRLSALLEKYLFNDANHQGDGVYPVSAQLACAESYDAQTGEPSATLDLDCKAQLDKLQPKIRVRGDAAKLDFTLLIGPSKSEPLELTLSKTEIAVRFDLGETAEVVKDLMGAEGTAAPNVRVDGTVAIGLKVLGPKHVELRAEIEDDLKLAFAPAGVSLESAAALRFSSESSKVFAWEVDALDERVTAAIDVGTTKLHTPAAGTDEPMIDLDLPGISAAVTVKKGEPVKITGVSLGNRDLTVAANGVRAATVSLNATNGRSVDITVSETATRETQMAFSTAFDLRMDVNQSLLGDDSGDLYQVTRVLLDGTTPTLSSSGDLLRVSSGRLQVITNPAQFGVDAAAGQCVAESSLGGLAVVLCTQL
jgi:hypothetical protein